MNLSNNVNDCSGFFDNKYMIGITMVIVNLGARFIVNELNDSQKNIINSKYTRRILIFLVIFMATRDLGISILLTFAVVIFLFEFFNEDSEYSLVPLVVVSVIESRKAVQSNEFSTIFLASLTKSPIKAE